MANKRQRKKNTKKKVAEIQERLRYIDITKASNEFDEQLEALRNDTKYLVDQIKSDEMMYRIYSSIIQRIDNIVNMPKPRKERALRKPELPKFPRHITYKPEPDIDEELPIYTSTDLRPRQYFFVPPEINDLPELLENDSNYAAQYLEKYEAYSRYVIDTIQRHSENGLGRATNYQAKGMYKIAIKSGGFERYVQDKWAENKDRPLDQIQAAYSEELLDMLESEVDVYETEKGDNAFDALNEAEKVLANLNQQAVEDIKTRYNNNKGRRN